MLYDQQRQMLSLLREDEYLTSAALAHALGVSERTIRTRIKALAGTSAACGARVTSKRSAGYRLLVVDRGRFEAFMGEGRPSSDVPQTPEERSRRIVALLLDSYGEYVSTESLADPLFVSNQTVYQNLDEVERILATEGIALERRPGYGVRAQGSEYAARNCIVNNVSDATSDKRFPVLMEALRVIDGVEGYRTTDYNYADICRYVIAMLSRQAKGNLISTEELPEVKDRAALAAAERAAHVIEEQLGERMAACERSYLAVVLASKRSTYGSIQTEGNRDIPRLVEEMVAGVRDSFGVELGHDDDFRQLLTEHLERLGDRVRLGIQQRHPALDQIRRDFGFAWAVAVQMSTIASRHFTTSLSNDEVGYLALIFDMALEKVHVVSKGKSILLVCPVGDSSTKLVEYRVRAALGPLVSRLETTSAQRINDFDLRTFSVVLTSTDAVAETQTPVVRVSLFPSDAEMARVRTLLGRSHLPDSLAYFGEERFRTHVPHGSLSQAIGEAGRIARADGVLSAADVLDNAVYQAGVLVVRPTLPLCEVSRCTVMVFERPIVWKVGQRVQALMFVSAGEGFNDLGYFYQVLGRFLADANSVGRLLRTADYRRFIDDWSRHAC